MSTRPRAAATPIAFVKALLLGYQKYGMDPAQALAAGQISGEALERPDARITAAQMESLSSFAMQELDDEALGWFSRKLPWGSLGMLCRASISSPNLEIALRRWCRHHGLLTRDVRLHMRERDGLAEIFVEERIDLGAMREFCLMTMMRNIHGYACWLIDSRIPLRETALPFAAPPHRKVYSHLFTGAVRFEQPQAGFIFDARYLQMPLRRDESALQTMLQRALLLTVLQYRRDRLLVQRVRSLLRAQPASLSNADAVARAVHMSARTLHRHLRDEGSSLQSLRDEVRREEAMRQLRRSSRPVKQIGLAVGFRDEKSFSRAFRHWTGKSPSEYRRG
jgi:AraC-like DNA-binding protein